MTFTLIVGLLLGFSPAALDYVAGGPNWAGAVGFSIVSSVLFGVRFVL